MGTDDGTPKRTRKSKKQKEAEALAAAQAAGVAQSEQQPPDGQPPAPVQVRGDAPGTPPGGQAETTDSEPTQAFHPSVLIAFGTKSSLRDVLTARQVIAEKIAALEAPIKPRVKELRAQEAALTDLIEGKLAVPMAGAYQLAGKTSGKLSFEADGVGIEVSRSKTVEWNQEFLAAMWAFIQSHGDHPGNYIDAKTVVEYTVPEPRFKKWPEQVQAKFRAGRVEKIGPPRYKFTMDAQEAPLVTEQEADADLEAIDEALSGDAPPF